ncbi:MAG: hypothetical protein IJ733_09910 [Lachnospiraceae bacterium]|nr:hypothetical protein [Lachnospiraceae bacterium]
MIFFKKVLKAQGEKAGITVFLTITFLLFFSMVGVMFESARVLSSEGYFRVAARSAAMTAFGDFNRELFQEYGLFAYGGYDGIGVENLNAEFLELLKKNLSAAPEGRERSYSDLYRFSEVESEIVDAKNLMEKEIFHGQIKGFLKRQAVERVTERVTDSLSENTGFSVKEKLAITRDYENGKYDVVDTDEGKETDDGGKGGQTTEAKTEEEDRKSKEKEEKRDTDAQLKKDAAGGNPLTVFSEFTGNGVLSLVCDEKDISKQEIPIREAVEQEEYPMQDSALEGSGKKSKSEKPPEKEMGAADVLEELMEEGNAEEKEVTKSENILSAAAEQSEFFLYASRQFADYTKSLEKTVKYGMEYLVAGKGKENLNLSYVVNRLLAIRLLLNMGYAVTDPVFQEKSLATASILAGFTGLPPVISAVQYTILMILSFEEACIDVTALLEGKEVPVVKNAGNFQMKYEEICICTKELFERKAQFFPKAKKWSASGASYQSYLYMLFLSGREETVRNRMGDLIQYDLRERYNQTFTIDACICTSTCRTEYCIPYLFSSLPFLSGSERRTGKRTQEVTYGYKSE